MTLLWRQWGSPVQRTVLACRALPVSSHRYQSYVLGCRPAQWEGTVASRPLSNASRPRSAALLHAVHVEGRHDASRRSYGRFRDFFQETVYESNAFDEEHVGSDGKGESEEDRKKVLVIAGCTGVGKTQISIEVALACERRARELGYDGAEIISGDAMQFYRGMDIGTAKIRADEMRGIRHHLLDTVSPTSSECNVGDYYDLAISKIEDIHDRGALPIVVGGTSYYLKWLILGKQKAPALDSSFLSEIEDIVRTDDDWDTSLARLAQLDPEYASTIPSQNIVRLCRALAVVTATGRPMKDFDVHGTAEESTSPFDFRPVFLVRDRSVMQRIVDVKVERMFANGFIGEVVDCMLAGLMEKHHAAKAVGYMEIITFLKSPEKPTIMDLKRLIHRVQDRTRSVARQQLKFARNKSMRHNFRWMDLDNIERLDAPSVSTIGRLESSSLSLSRSAVEAATESILDLLNMPRARFDAIKDQFCMEDTKIKKNTKEARAYMPKLLYYTKDNLERLQKEILDDKWRLRRQLQYRL